MEKEKKYLGGWWMWIIILLIGTTIIFTGLNYLGIIGKTVVERKVFENSYQKFQADVTARTSYHAQLALLKRKLRSSNLDKGTKIEIQAQIDAINIMKATKGD